MLYRLGCINVFELSRMLYGFNRVLNGFRGVRSQECFGKANSRDITGFCSCSFKVCLVCEVSIGKGFHGFRF